MKVHQITYSLDTLDSVADDIYEIMPLVSILTFSGPLGAGKTTLVQALLKRCGVEDDIQSPTFTYVSSYSNAQDQTFYHFDLYRLNSLQDFHQAGFDEYLYQPKSWALIEWPEIIKPVLKRKVCDFVLEYAGEDKRTLRYTVCQ
jgi:tRNA threonylcarbamoyladenosine biosynthesis protein TsaE